MKVAKILPVMIVSEKAESGGQRGCKLEGKQADGTLIWDYASCRPAGESKKLSFRKSMDFAATEFLPERNFVKCFESSQANRCLPTSYINF
ncbi:unnamed protein product [Oikopleura dioica]|uniref:Uncharacterized protein n=1 Tax=Oikopleura dioica TaxID=34765 RepID=E4WPX0_OIKDI|nr:unnamed protein product [Oikopleura dioica]